MDIVGKKFKIGKTFSLIEKKGYSYLCMCLELAGKKQNTEPKWKILMKDVDLEELTSFLGHVYLGCTQRECETSKDIVDNFKNMFESRISGGVLKFIHVVNNDTIMHAVHTCAVAFSTQS